MDKELQKQIINAGRNFMKFTDPDDFQSDQDLKLPQPPLVKANMRAAERAIDLPRDFENLNMKQDFIEILTKRKSSRVYSAEPVSLLQLSFLLWATQGIKDIRGKSYATLRTVASGGARHGFETYLAIRDIDGLKPGIYHYLPMGHKLELLNERMDADEEIKKSLCGQSFGARANVVFYWSFVAYRCEWRYGVCAHRPALMDVGHVCENLYLACAALGIGTCAIAALDNSFCDQLFELDGEEEFMIYAAPVGSISESDKEKEQAFYQFVEDQGL